MKRIIILFLTAIMVLGLCGCGSSEKTLTVDHIRYSPSPVKGGESFYIVGTQGEVRPVYNSGYIVTGVFKDCTVTKFQVGEDGQYHYKGDGSGGYMIDVGVTLTVKDAAENTHTVKVEKGTVLKLDDDGNLLLPED